MKTYNPTFNRDSEFRLTQRLDRLEKALYRVKQSLLKWLIGTAFVVTMTESIAYAVLHY